MKLFLIGVAVGVLGTLTAIAIRNRIDDWEEHSDYYWED